MKLVALKRCFEKEWSRMSPSRDTGINTVTSRTKESEWGWLVSKNVCNLVGGLLDLIGILLGDFGWNFWESEGVLRLRETQEGGNRKGGPGALWNSYKPASWSLASLCISFSTSPEQAPPLPETFS